MASKSKTLNRTVTQVVVVFSIAVVMYSVIECWRASPLDPNLPESIATQNRILSALGGILYPPGLFGMIIIAIALWPKAKKKSDEPRK